MRKWKPTASQRREFSERMKDPAEQEAFEQRKVSKANKKRSASRFDYSTAGGSFIPTKEQHDYCMSNLNLFNTKPEIDAARFVIAGYVLKEKVSHDYIHIVNEKRRAKTEVQDD